MSNQKLTFSPTRPDSILPTRSPGDSGLDLYSNFNGVDEPSSYLADESFYSVFKQSPEKSLLSEESYLTLEPGDTAKIPTGLILNLQKVFYCTRIPGVESSEGFSPNFGAISEVGEKICQPYLLGAQVRTKSGLAVKQGLVVTNSPGTIDTSYDKELIVLLTNTSKVPQKIFHLQKVAQLVPEIVPVFEVEWQETATTQSNLFSRTGGFGSTGLRAEV